MKMTRIEQIWNELENDNSFSQGLLLRRYSASVLPDVFIGLKSPERIRCLAASVSREENINITSFSNLRDINVELLPDAHNEQRNLLLFKLLNNQHQDIFSVLCEDLIVNISVINNEPQLIRELLNRFEQWKSLFDKAGLQGLTAEEQRGLYGELFFIRKFFQSNSNYSGIINSWLGPERQIRDFQSGSWSVEVKTTFGNNHQKVHISNERQLDISNLENLFLFHISLEIRQQSGETLNHIVDSVIELLSVDFPSLNRFKNKLLEYGYFDQHRNLYSEKGYFIRHEVFYKVENEFPRIEESDIRNGVGDVKYSIVISQCTSFVKSEQEVFETITF